MKARPILFSGEMVRALLDGRKTQTRRVIKPIKGEGLDPAGIYHFHPGDLELMRCPYGKVGDLLWVRETFVDWPTDDGSLIYRADDSGDDYNDYGLRFFNWKPSIFMPKWASRLTLEITDIRVERLQDISGEGCIAEGLSSYMREHDACCDLKNQYQALWQRINGVESWRANPWVWVIDFKVHHKNFIEMMGAKT